MRLALQNYITLTTWFPIAHEQVIQLENVNVRTAESKLAVWDYKLASLRDETHANQSKS